MLDDEAKALWSELVAVFAAQEKHSPSEAAKTVGCKKHQAWRIYHNGFARAKLPPIKEVIGAVQAESRALREADNRLEEADDLKVELRLSDAQADSRRVLLQEGQMIAASAMGVARYVEQLRGLMAVVEPVMQRMQEDIEALAGDEVDGVKVTTRQRQDAVREVVWLQQQALKMVRWSMELERIYADKPIAIIGVELEFDVEDLTRRALESAKAVQLSAMLIDVTPEATTKH